MSPILGIYASQISGHLWEPAGAYDALWSTTVASGGVSSVTISNIPSTYKHLEVRYIGSNATSSNRIRIQFNSDTASNYSTHLLIGNGTAASAVAGANTDKIPVSVGDPGSSTAFAAGVISILDYANTNKYKTVRTLTGKDANGSGEIDLISGSWRSTSAVTSLKFFWDTGNVTEYSSIALYGVN